MSADSSAGPAAAERGLVLHFGAHKTASTHLQMTLQRHRGRLEEQGVSVFLPQDLRRDGLRLQNHLGAPGGDSTLKPVLREAFAAPKGRVVVSEENMLGQVPGPELLRSGRLYPRLRGRLELLRELLPDAPETIPVTIAVSVREPLGFLASCWSQRLLGGRVTPFESLYGGFHPEALSWTDLVRRFVNGWPGARVIVWTYADWPRVGPKVLRELLGPGIALPTLDAGVSHAGLSARAAAESVARAPAEGEEARALVREMRNRWPKGPNEPGVQPFDDETRARATEAHARDLEALRGLRAVEWLAP